MASIQDINWAVVISIFTWTQPISKLMWLLSEFSFSSCVRLRASVPYWLMARVNLLSVSCDVAFPKGSLLHQSVKADLTIDNVW